MPRCTKRPGFWLAVVGLLALSAALVVYVTCPTGSGFEFACHFRVSGGMTLGEVESVLGPGKEEPWPPCEKDTGAVVTGDRYFYWEQDGMEFWVGLKGGHVSGTWFCAPSL
jgi:hypothetical protein